MTNKLAEYRKKNGLSQRKLAAKAGVSLSYIKVIEDTHTDTNVSISVAFRLAQALNTDIETLFMLPVDNKN